MAHFAALDSPTWRLLLALPVLLLILALVFRNPVWKHLLAFSLATLTTGTGENFYNVYVLRNVDPKFYPAPDVDSKLGWLCYRF